MNPFRRSKSPNQGRIVSDENTYAPPQGPPPSRLHPHSMPPAEEYAPPPGPPPWQQQTQNIPDEPPPSYEEWMSIPENKPHHDLPPPPSIQHDRSRVNNASEESGKAGFDWCERNPMWPARQFEPNALHAILHGRANLVSAIDRWPPNSRFIRRQGKIDGDGLTDHYFCFMSDLPLYTAFHNAPHNPGQQFTAYFEVQILKLNPRRGGVAIGFAVPPYPYFRLPGWERGSLAVHGDDGHRFVNDAFGGRDFTKPFKNGEVVGIGIEISSPANVGAAGKVKYGTQLPHSVTCFLVRNGQRTAQLEWDLHEEIDSTMVQPGGVQGLEGFNDLHAAVGIYGEAQAIVRFGRENCSWWPANKP